MPKIYAAAAILAVLLAALYGAVQYGRVLERAEHSEEVAKLQEQLAEKSLQIQEYENAIADKTRQATDAERERINAIRANDHTSKEVQRLQAALNKARAAAADDGPGENDSTVNYRVVSIDAINRVWNEGADCVGLPDSERTSVLQTRLPEVTGDGIAGAIKYAQAEYCGCGLKYNELWRSYQRTVDECNKKAPG